MVGPLWNGASVIKNIWKILKQSYRYFSQAQGTRQAAALTFYTLFSLAPILLVAVALIGLFLQNRIEEILGEILTQAGQFLGPRAVDMLRTLLEKLSWERDSWWATIIGVSLTLFGATTVFASLKDSLNDIWSVRPTPEINSLKFFFQTRLFSVFAVLILGVLFIVLFFLSALASGFDQYLSGKLDLPVPLLSLINNFSVILVMFFFLWVLFKMLPDVKQGWGETGWGALFTTGLLLIGKYGISQYLKHNSLASFYGAAGSLVVLLLWIYYSAAILFFGAAFVRALRTYRGKRLIPRRYAAKVVKTFE